MSQTPQDQQIMPTILDRLVDPESAGTLGRFGYDVNQMIDAVRRDVEDLLNTRQTHFDIANHFQEVRHSIAAYGLPDLVSLNAVTPQQREEIARMIEAVIQQFEPRLKEVKATILSTGDKKDRNLHYRIEGKLHVEPSPELAFDTVLELSTGHYSVKSADT